MRTLIFLVAGLGLALSACSEESPPVPPSTEPAGHVVHISGCISGFTDDRAGSAESCVRFQYDTAAQILRLTHENAAFNCCPEKIGADISIEKGSIVVTEWEKDGNCDCNCLYDIDLAIEDLPLGQYTVRMVEPLRSNDDQELTFSVDLAVETEGRVCVPRNFYPWGI